MVDADESNAGLYRMLGLEKAKTLAEYLGGKRCLKDRINGGDLALPKAVEEIPAEVLSKKGNIAAISIGKIEEPGEGCACPYGLLAKEFLKKPKLGEGKVALMDTEAGIEHFGRRLDLGVDHIVNVEPNVELITLSRKIRKLLGLCGTGGKGIPQLENPSCQSAGIGKCHFILFYFPFLVGKTAYAAICGNHLMLEEEGVDRLQGRFDPIAATHRDRPPDLVPQLPPETPGTIHEGLQGAGHVVEEDRGGQDQGIGFKQLGVNLAHVVLNTTLAFLNAEATGITAVSYTHLTLPTTPYV